MDDKKQKQWKKIKGTFTPGGDPVYICSICYNPASIHTNGIESPQNRDKCPCCGEELVYP